jgi:hypothetical protein
MSATPSMSAAPLSLTAATRRSPRCRRTPRLPVRVRRLAQDADDANDFLSHDGSVRTAPPVPKTCPQDSRAQGSAISNALFSSGFRYSRPRPPRGAPPYDGGALSDRTSSRFAGIFH